jgi:4-amino-4-deoxy-L-arabinose transferase-like glycosyltransferase
MHFKKNMVFKYVKKFSPIILVILFTLFLRFSNLERRAAFDADQEEIAGRAKELLSGNPVLLGPKTSLGGFSIGPGFTYVWGVASIFTKGNPIAGPYTSVFLGVGFVLLIYLFSRKFYSDKTALILSFISAVSITLIIWDQNAWAPSLFYLAELLVIYGVYISETKPIGTFILLLGLIIGFQAHFAIFLLLPAILIYWLMFKPKFNRKWTLYSLLIVIVGLAPGIIFDVTHHFVNFERLLSVFKLAVTGTPPHMSKIVMTLISNSAGFYYIFFSTALRVTIFSITVLICAIGVVKEIKYRKILTLSFLFLFVPFIFFVFYRSNFSEYYLMTALPSFIILSGYIFEKINKYYVITIAIVIFLAFINIKAWNGHVKPMNLWAKKQTIETIIEMGGKSGYGVSLSVEAGYRFGYQFLFDYYNATPNIPPLKDQKKIFTIVVPPGYRGIEAEKNFDGVGLRWEGVR